MFGHIKLRKYISFKIQNHLPMNMPKQTYCTNKGMAVELQSGDYWYFTQVKTTMREYRAILVVLPTIFAGVNT